MAMRRRHNLALHSWGIVAGLEPRMIPAPGSNSLIVDTGMAIDGYGRELVLAAPQVTDMQLYNKDTTYDIWLYYLKKGLRLRTGRRTEIARGFAATPGWKNNQPSS